MMERFIGTKIIEAEPQKCQVKTFNSRVGDPGYKVKYEDGYISWSPAKAFEEAYRKTDGMTLGLAVEATLEGYTVVRDGWNGNGMCVAAQIPDKDSKMTHPYLYITIPGCEEGTRSLPWQPAQVDIFATDYRIV